MPAKDLSAVAVWESDRFAREGGVAGGLCFGKRECDPWSNAAPLFDQVGEVETGDRARGPLLALQVHAVSIGLLGQRRRGEREVMRVRARSRT